MGFDLVVMGQGYVGLPLALEASKAGLSVAGFDLNEATLASLNSGISHIDDISDCEVRSMLDSGYIATNDSSALSGAAAVVICVPTPLGDGGAPDLSAVTGAVEIIASRLSPGTLVVLESTTYPGTTEEVVLPILESQGAKLDSDFWLAFSPERIDPGNKVYGLKNTPKVVGGVTEESTKRAEYLYSRFVDTVVTVKGAKEAETSKLLENTYRHINIALVNEMSKFCHDLNIDLWEVIRAAETKPFGFHAFYPGPGVGGHCIPIDPNYLSFQVQKTLKYPFRFVELAQEINQSMPMYVVTRIQDILNDQKKSLNGSKVLLLGVTYKADIADQRESPAKDVADLLLKYGCDVLFHDPYVHTWTSPSETLECVPDLEASLVGADVVVLLQNHSEYDVDAYANLNGSFLDTRGNVSVKGAVRL